ncbi:hypothetical protein BH11PAT2_BH11PAT2_02840 [soil metagenome]
MITAIPTRDRSMGDKPWAIIEPIASARPKPSYVPDTAIEEGGFWWWIEGSKNNWRVMYASEETKPQEAQNSEYPDRVWDSLIELKASR